MDIEGILGFGISTAEQREQAPTWAKVLFYGTIVTAVGGVAAYAVLRRTRGSWGRL
jgi:hypothetical protein